MKFVTLSVSNIIACSLQSGNNDITATLYHDSYYTKCKQWYYFHFVKCKQWYYFHFVKCKQWYYFHFVKCKQWFNFNIIYFFILLFTTIVVFNNVIAVRSEMWVLGFTNHSCHKSLSKSLGFASWFGKTFLALMISKTQYSHFLLTAISHCWKLLVISL